MTDSVERDLAAIDEARALTQEPPPEWPPTIAFLVLKGARKSAKCLLCSAKDVSAYEGEGLSWKLCKKHAWAAAVWAPTQTAAMAQHAANAAAASAAARAERTAARMRRELTEGLERSYARQEPVGGASVGTQGGTASLPPGRLGEQEAHGGSESDHDRLADGASESRMGEAVTDDPAL